MTTAIVVSKDRAAQLDLCLRSLAVNAPWVTRTTVVWKASYADYRDGYRLCAKYHRHVNFCEETSFQTQVSDALKHGDHAMFVCDDDVIYRRLDYDEPPPADLLDTNPNVLCVSLRLGLNTAECYSLRRRIRPPAFVDPDTSYLKWRWRDGDGEWSYPGSLDGHIWRSEQLRILLTATWTHEDVEWGGPNELEDHLHRTTRTALLPQMACYRAQCLVGVPVNSVQSAYRANRHAERFPAAVEELNRRFLLSHRLSLASVDAAAVNAPHVEFPLRFEQDLARSAA